MDDYSEFTKPTGETSLTELTELAEQQAQLEAAVEQAEQALKKVKEDLRLISEVALPEKMEALGMETFTTTHGLKIKVKETIRASLPKENPGASLNWLREQGHGGVIKRVVKLEFGMGQDTVADEVGALLEEHGHGFTDESNVHFMTLGALAKERLTAGKDMPSELFNIHRQRVAKLG